MAEIHIMKNRIVLLFKIYNRKGEHYFAER